ncbi:MAG: extracellular solute-binding protein [Chloroflexota bacterium]
MTALSRRSFIQVGGATGAAALAAACAPAAAPAPTASQPTGGTQPSGQASDAWKQDWDRAVEAAKKEGKVVVITGSGSTYRKGFDLFETTYPGITVEHQGFASMSIFAPKAIQERKAGIYSFDVAIIPSLTAFSTMKPEGFWDPIRPVLVHPEVTDDKAWGGGFEWGFLDKEKRFSYGYSWKRQVLLYRNDDLIKDGEVKTFKDMLNPKWKGKIAFAEPWTSGYTYPMAMAIRDKFGDSALRQLFVDMQPDFLRDPRLITEGLIRGKYAYVTGVPLPTLGEFVDQGIGKNVRPLFIPEIGHIGEDTVFVFNRAPHSNAAKVLINWLLTKAGQEVWSPILVANSRRTDVKPVETDAVVQPGDDKFLSRLHVEEVIPKIEETREVLKNLLAK